MAKLPLGVKKSEELEVSIMGPLTP